MTEYDKLCQTTAPAASFRDTQPATNLRHDSRQTCDKPVLLPQINFCGDMNMSRLIPPALLTEDGGLDLTKLTLDPTMARVTSGPRDEARNGLRVLAAIQQAGRTEAGIFLLGFLWNLPSDDLEMRGAVVEALEHFQTPGCAYALFTELRRVKSSNTTRYYLATILGVLSQFPKEIVAPEFLALAEDKSFSYKMRAKFRELVFGAEIDQGQLDDL